MLELAQDEIRNLGKVWATVFVSLSYCFIIGKIIPKGFARLVAVLPIISVFIVLPLNLTSLHFCGLTSFFISWLANFKLLLFAFGKPPLSSHPPISFPRFLAIACLPIKVQTSAVSQQNGIDPERKSCPPHENSLNHENKQDPDQKSPNQSCPSPQNLQKSPWNYIIKAALLGLFMFIYDYAHHIPYKIMWIVYFFHIYFALEVILAGLAASAKLLMGLELEPQFNEPLLSTSLQDFWGKRWNLMVTSILRPTVYLPTRDLLTGMLGRQVATLTAVMSTFIVSALMHELIFFYLGREKPTFEVTRFFLLHGVCLCAEIAAKKRFGGGKRRIPRWVSGPATLGFMAATGVWLFLPPLLRSVMDARGLQEYAAICGLANNVTRAATLTFQWLH